MPSLRFLCNLLLATVALALSAGAQVPMQEQPTPFSTWLDFNALSKPTAEKPSLPIWIESFQEERFAGSNTEPPKTVFRLRLRRMPSLHQEILLRVFFNDLPDMCPVVSTWSETGAERFRSKVLGIHSALPTSESLVLKLEGVDYIDIEVPGDGSTARGVFISSLKAGKTYQTQDYAAAPELVDPFGNFGPLEASEEDSKLFGRVKATIDPGLLRLSRKEGLTGIWQFEIATQPLLALVTFEVLNADVSVPLMISVNGQPAVPASVFWPDLADPGFRGESRAAGMRMQYTGWLRAQCIVPGSYLPAGLNRVNLTVSEESGPLAVRTVELQLKNNWTHFDYILTPSHP